MKIPSKSPAAKGSSLIEAVIAVGVLAVAVPLVFGTMIQSGEASLNAQAETRCSWIVPACVEELQRAMRGESECIDPLTPGKNFPSGGIVALAFSSEGKLLGKVSSGEYEKGVSKVANQTVRYIASLSGELPAAASPQVAVPRLEVNVVMEYPAVATAAKRQKIEFNTQMP